MIISNRKDSIHKAWMYRVLEEISSDKYLVSVLYFKGGTCASILGWLDRFSVDLDFDFAGDKKDILKTRIALEKIFSKLGFSIKDKSKTGLQYFLKYKNNESERNILKIDITFPILKSNKYRLENFLEIGYFINCQTKETMFANKLVALLDRFEKTGGIAGRDIYDIHHFFMEGFDYDTSVIEERRGVPIKDFFISLYDFIDKKVTDKILSEDLNSLLSYKEFLRIRKVLKRETMTLIKDEINNL